MLERKVNILRLRPVCFYLYFEIKYAVSLFFMVNIQRAGTQQLHITWANTAVELIESVLSQPSELRELQYPWPPSYLSSISQPSQFFQYFQYFSAFSPYSPYSPLPPFYHNEFRNKNYIFNIFICLMSPLNLFQLVTCSRNVYDIFIIQLFTSVIVENFIKNSKLTTSRTLLA